jgi:hypothetical protein
MKYLLITLTIANTLLFAGTSKAQVTGDTSGFVQKLTWIEEVYYRTSFLSFDVAYYYEELDSTGTIRDTMTGSCKINGNHFWSQMDSVEMMQNDYDRIAVYKEDSIMQLDMPIAMSSNLFKVNLYDTLFQKLNVDRVEISTVGKKYKMKFVFRSDAPYMSYELLFDTATYYIAEIQYQVKKSLFITPPEGSSLPLPNDFITVRTVFTNYQTGAFAESVFLSSRYFNKQNNQVTPVSPYTGFSVINNNVED